MLQMTGFDAFFQATGWLYIAVALLAAVITYRVVKRKWGKPLIAAVVLMLFAAYPLSIIWRELAVQKAQQQRSATAQAMLEDRCKRAGVRIHRTVNDVEGVFLLKVRPSTANHGDQFLLDDPYGHDFGGSAYVRSFLRGHYEANTRKSDGSPSTNSLLGFSHVEAIDPADGKRYRYSGAKREVTHVRSVLMGGDGRTTFKTIDFVADAIPTTGPAPRYGVTYDDISTRDEREFWIAGSSLKVIDLQTNEVIAERIGYMRDPGMGNTTGGRSPWLFALNTACPPFVDGRGNSVPAAAATDYQAYRFVQQVLKPKEEK